MIHIKTAEEIQYMREGGKLLASVLESLRSIAIAGNTTMQMDELAEKLILEAGGRPSFKGYGAEHGNPFPATICASLNDEIVHGIPSEKIKLKDGDLLKIDIGMEYRGFHTDMARTIAVGEITEEAKRLVEVTEKSFWKGVGKMKAGADLSDYSRAVQEFVESNGFSVVRNLVGHGIGKDVHEDPQIPNYFNKKFRDFKLAAGMTLALEPMVNVGGFETIIGQDGWVFKTKDGSLAAHYENTLVITDNGVEVLTISK